LVLVSFHGVIRGGELVVSLSRNAKERRSERQRATAAVTTTRMGSALARSGQKTAQTVGRKFPSKDAVTQVAEKIKQAPVTPAVAEMMQRQSREMREEEDEEQERKFIEDTAENDKEFIKLFNKLHESDVRMPGDGPQSVCFLPPSPFCQQ